MVVMIVWALIANDCIILHTHLRKHTRADYKITGAYWGSPTNYARGKDITKQFISYVREKNYAAIPGNQEWWGDPWYGTRKTLQVRIAIKKKVVVPKPTVVVATQPVAPKPPVVQATGVSVPTYNRNAVTATAAPTYPRQPVRATPVQATYPAQPRPTYPVQATPVQATYPAQPRPTYPVQATPVQATYPAQPRPAYPVQPRPAYPAQPRPVYPAQPRPAYPAQPRPAYPTYPASNQYPQQPQVTTVIHQPPPQQTTVVVPHPADRNMDGIPDSMQIRSPAVIGRQMYGAGMTRRAAPMRYAPRTVLCLGRRYTLPQINQEIQQLRMRRQRQGMLYAPGRNRLAALQRARTTLLNF